MEKRKQSYIDEMLKLIQEKKIFRFSHCFAFTSFSSATAYNHELEKVESIKEALTKNRAEGRNYLMQKWMKSDNATLQLALMRLIGSPEEHRLLNQQYIENSVKVDKPIFDIKPLDDDTDNED